jgi:glycerophosphoryl diester phosphodiesterase
LQVVLFTASVQPAPEIHAHRGGPLVDGVPAFAEQTMPAFHHSALAQRATLELDVKLTRDGVPVVLHDEAVDRTTDGSGRLCDLDLGAFAGCRADLLGTGAVTTRVAPFIALPTFEEVLTFAREHAVRLNVEVKNEQHHSDFDPSSRAADVVARMIAASKFPQERLQIQSFWAGDLDLAREHLPRVTLGLLNRPPHHDSAIVYASASGYQVLGPQWPVKRKYVERAHEAGLRVIPFTLNDPADIRKAARIGCDGIITDDPVAARKALAKARRRPATAA